MQLSLRYPPRTVAALFVQSSGPYFGIEGVDPWDVRRDARAYEGPYPVVAHPPCARWGRYYFGSPSSAKRFKLGEDGGAFNAAIRAVRTCGGVLEHPRDSKAWPAHGIAAPPLLGGWVPAGDGLGFTCCVDQGWYGHLARKPTWLYVAHIDRHKLPELHWGSSKEHIEAHMARIGRRITRRSVLEMLSRNQRAATPAEFRDMLIGLARLVKP